MYNGVFRLPATQSKHDSAVATHDFSALENLANAFAKDRGLEGVSHRVVVVHPHLLSIGHDDWTIGFKSVRIGMKVAERMGEQERKQLRKTYTQFRNMSEGSVLAGRIFEAIFNDMFTKGWEEGSAPQVFRMTSEGDPPVFKEPSSPSAPLQPLPSRTRAIVDVRDFSGLGDVTLDENNLYISVAVNNPLFGSFTIDFEGGIVVISIYQVTIAESHGESSRGYLLVRQIIGRVRELLNQPNLKPEVRYFLVCPVDGSKHQWKMPKDWSKNNIKRNHQGDPFCMRVPLTEHLGASCLFSWTTQRQLIRNFKVKGTETLTLLKSEREARCVLFLTPPSAFTNNLLQSFAINRPPYRFFVLHRFTMVPMRSLRSYSIVSCPPKILHVTNECKCMIRV